jgi:hypothetical protein
MSLFEKHFSVEEARAWLPKLRERLTAAQALYTEMESLQADFERAVRRVRQNGSAPPVAFEEQVSKLQSLIQEIVDAGIEIKDIRRGLVDFPHWRGGEEVFLCWEMGEDELRFWHRIEDGYPGRQPI